MDEFKTCPFCGEHPKMSDRLEIEGGKMKTLYHIWCPGCGVRTKDFDTNYSAIIAWNQRAEK